LEGLDDMNLHSIVGSTGRKNAPASLSFLSECIVDRQKRCCKELIVDMLVPIGVGGAGVGLEEGES
jgi:hypothetical protein